MTPTILEKELNFLALAKKNESYRKAVNDNLERALCRQSSFYLGYHVLGYDKFSTTHIRWDKWANKHIDFTGGTPSKTLILQPRETLKTTFFTIASTIRFLLNNPQLSILIANDSADNAQNMVVEIKNHFERNKKLRYLFGDFVQWKTWGKVAFTINRKTKSLKEPSVAATGIGAATTSRHPDVIFLDDIAGEKDRTSEAGREQTMNFFKSQWDLLKKDTGIVIIPGTRKHVNDIYWHILENVNPQLKREGLIPFHVMILPAHENGDPESKVVNFPDILPEDKLRELRITKIDKDGVDFATYMAEYELNPLDPKTQIFKVFQFFDHTKCEYEHLVLWTDPAMKEKKDSDYSAIVVLGRIKTGEHRGKLGIVYASIEKRNPTKLVNDHNRIYNTLSDKYPDVPFNVYMEENGFRGLREFAVEKAINSVNKRPVPTIGFPNTEDKDQRIKCLEPAITSGMLLFRQDYLTAEENYRLLVEQFKNFPQGKKDGPDATQGAYKRITYGASMIYTGDMYEEEEAEDAKAREKETA